MNHFSLATKGTEVPVYTIWNFPIFLIFLNTNKKTRPKNEKKVIITPKICQANNLNEINGNGKR